MRGRGSRITGLVLITQTVGLMVLGPVYAGQEGEWREVMRQDGVEVWSREVQGSENEEVRGSLIINAPVAALEWVIDDVPASVRWLPSCREARVIRKIDDNSREILFITDMPWPMADRESLLMTEKHEDGATGGVVIGFRSVNDPAVPVGKDNVRMQDVKGRWVLTPEGGDKTRVSYLVKGGPGGSVPVYLANAAGRDLTFRTLTGLRSFLLKDRTDELP